MSGKFVHLHTHSEYSILDSSCKIAGLINRATKCGMDSLALTDHGVMSGAIKFYREAKKQGIKPIIGCEVYLAPGDRRERKVRDGQKYFHLVLLASDDQGYKNLVRLVSLGHTEGFYYKPRVDKELLQEYHTGLIALSACESGEIPRLLTAGQEKKAIAVAQEYRQIFGEDNFYIELQDHGTKEGRSLKQQLQTLAHELELPVVATNDIHYLSKEDSLAHEVLLNVRANKKLADSNHLSFDGDGYHFRAHEEMAKLFSDVPEAIENTRVIAARCNLELEFGATMIPPFELTAEEGNPDEYLRTLAYRGAERYFETITSTVRERLDYELDVIKQMNYATYFLIVWDFVRFARKQHIPVGPGRGSAAGSLVSYCTEITRVNPLKYGLIFERFLNPARISMPDFDIDFCVNGRDQVIDYVRDKYGDDKTAQIATYDRMAARSVVRDVGRVLGVSYGTTDRLAKMIPSGYKLETAVAEVAELKTLYKTDETTKKIVDIGQRLEGLTRNTSTHAAGVVISADPLTNHVPLLRLSGGEIVTQFDMTDVEAIGLLKFDFLGLRNLTLIDETCKSIRDHDGIEIDIESLPLDNKETFQLIRAGKTAGIFQLESSGMTSLIKRVQPKRFEDLVALLALHRPGPLESGMADDYVERRNGRQQATYPHSSLQEVLEETYGLPIYQDQIMLMAQKLAGFSLSEADILRKAMGKKNKAMMRGLKKKFISGCQANGISGELAIQSFSDMEKFSRYGFNKSHATAYAFISYWTAYLKTHYPTHFMASLLTSTQGNLDKIAEYISRCRKMGIDVLPPDINESKSSFTPISKDRIRFGLTAIKHVGSGAIASILAVRGNGFESLSDFCHRIGGENIDRETLEALIKTGAFDSFGAARKGLLLFLPEGLELMQIARRERQSGQQSFFGNDAESTPEISKEEFSQQERLGFERELLGLYVSAHPLDEHREVLSNYYMPLTQLLSIKEGERVTVGGRVKKLRKIPTKNGGQMAFLSLEDGITEAEITVFPKLLESDPFLLDEDQLIGLCLSAGSRNGQINLIAEKVFPLDEITEKRQVSLVITLTDDRITQKRLDKISDILKLYVGQSPLIFDIQDESGNIEVTTGKEYRVNPCEELKASLEQIVDKGNVLLLTEDRN